MDFLTGLGFFGLLGIVALVVIYLLKPNYQQKSVSSTHIWKLSLKYKKRRIPVSKIRNLLIVICQVLIVCVSAFILAQPFIANAIEVREPEKIMVLDASANMQARLSHGLPTRFERAVDQMRTLGQQTILNDNGLVTVIIAGIEPSTLLFRTDNLAEFNDALDSLVVLDARYIPAGCTFGSADIDGAMDLTADIIYDNPAAELIFYTATSFAGTVERADGVLLNGSVRIVDVSHPDEWNAAILNAEAVLEENFYMFTADVAVFGRNEYLTVRLEIEGADVSLFDGVNVVNIYDEFISIDVAGEFFNNDTETIFFNDFFPDRYNVHSFRSAIIQLYNVNDSFPFDNSFTLQGPKSRDTIRILYVSQFPPLSENFPNPELANQPAHNVFFNAALGTIREVFEDRWDIRIDRAVLNADRTGLAGGELFMIGYDFYIFEHIMPRMIPTDGVVLIANPDRVPDNLDIRIDGSSSGRTSLLAGEADRLSGAFLNAVNPGAVAVTQLTHISVPEAVPDRFSYLMIAEENGRPAFMVKDEPDARIAILPFSIHNSNLTVRLEFPVLMLNMFDYFFPATVSGRVYEVNQPIHVNTRATSMQLNLNGNIADAAGQGTTWVFDGFPSSFTVSVPGSYAVTYRPFGREQDVHDIVFVRVPAIESDFIRLELLNAPMQLPPDRINWDLIVIFAGALIALLFLERLLHIRSDQF